ncbi:MAG: TIGR03663 family protein [Anaerolineae bacterium]|nr:TIGR03663 family protein [Anaerolineae bacterium]NIN95817.1 TIGR03663 family protein [Anaerolineae bacterium]NIQ78783.1 TIGR03663 family protein [Anaerolineae bacterium]
MEKRFSVLDKPLLARITLNWELICWVAIILVAIALRFWDLGSRAQHHDESMHSFYSWELYRGRGFIHNPLLHGPFLYHATAVIYFLFGASDYTSRVAPALFGVGIVVAPYFLRKWLGRYGALATAAMLAISPGFLYFSRFIRMDIFVAAFELLMFIAIIKYLDQRKDLYVYLLAAALAFAFSTKEIAYITIFIFGTFLVILLVWEWLRDRKFPPDFASFDLLILIGSLCAPLYFSTLIIKVSGLWDPLDYMNYGQHDLLVMLLITGVFALLGVWWSWRRWVTSAGIFWVIYILLHTTLLTNMLGLLSGPIGALGYWLVQQGVKRGGQPWYYYLIIIPLYEFLPLLLGLMGMGYLSFRTATERREEAAREAVSPLKNIFWIFLSYWFLVTLVIYGWSTEKMPWLIVHLTLPLILLAGRFIGDVLERADWQELREGRAYYLLILVPTTELVLLGFLSASLGLAGILSRGLPAPGFSLGELNTLMRWLITLLLSSVLIYVIILLARRLRPGSIARVLLFATILVMMVFTVRYAWIATYIHGDIAKDMLVYTQTTPDVTMIVEEIENLSERLEGGKDMKVAFDDFTSWPMWWYLRDYPNKAFFGKEPMGSLDAPVVLVGLDNEDAVRPYLTDYIRRQYRLRWWFPEDYKNLTPEFILGNLRNPDTRQSFIDFLLYRELENPLGSSDFAFYMRKDVAAEIWESSAVPIALEIEASAEYAEAYREVSSVAAWGQSGALEGQFSFPKGLAIDSEGKVYVADSQNHRIQKFDSGGEFITAWGSFGTEPGQFSEPWGIAVDDDGNVYVADTWNHRIQKFTTEGDFVTYWGAHQNTEGQLSEPQGLFWGPRDIAIDAEGNLYVTDTGNKRVQKFDSDGNPLGQWGGGGSLPGQFQEPVGIASDQDANIYVADTWNQRIQIFDPDSRFRRQWRVDAWWGDSVVNKPYLAVDGEGRVYTTDPEGHRALVFDSEGKLLAIFGKYGTDETSFDLPTGIEVDGEGNVYVSDSNNHRIMKFAPIPMGPGY